MSVEQFTLSGYDDRKELLAQRYNRAGKSLFVIALPLHLIPTHMPIPDPSKPFEGNRTAFTSTGPLEGPWGFTLLLEANTFVRNGDAIGPGPSEMAGL